MHSINPKVSFLMSVYNGEKYLEKSLISIKNQTYKNYEIIIVNDASTDKTLSIIKKYKKFFQSFKIINNKENIGLTNSLNLAAKFAKGEWLARLDADDVCHNLRLDKQLKLCLSNKSIALVGSGCNFIDSKSNFLFSKSYGSKSEEIISKLEKVNAFFPHSSALINKSIFLELGGYDEFFKFSQDYDLWLRISEKYKIAASRDFLVDIRIHNNRISSKKTRNKQFIFARVAIILYWLRNLYNIKLNNKIKKDIYKNTISYISKKSYYKGYFYFQNIKELFSQSKYIKSLFFTMRIFHLLLIFIIQAISKREYFLKLDSIKILKNNY